MLYRDFAEFIAALNRHDVRYLIVEAHAVAVHARPRATKDLDILLDPEPANAERAVLAIRNSFGDQPAHYISLEDLILVKTASNRAQDRADVQHLRKAQARRQ